MAEILKINGHDYSQYVVRKGYGWTRNDVDSPEAGRTLDTVMHRGRLGVKRTLAFKLLEMPQDVAAQLDDDLGMSGYEQFDATYLDLHGVMTKTFYCTTFTITCDSYYSPQESYWVDGSFTMIEV